MALLGSVQYMRAVLMYMYSQTSHTHTSHPIQVIHVNHQQHRILSSPTCGFSFDDSRDMVSCSPSSLRVSV
jgi:hypothetical protein